MRAALVNKETGVVDNVVEYDPDGEWSPPDECDLIPLDNDETIGPGHRRKQGKWSPPAPRKTRETVDHAASIEGAKNLDELKAVLIDIFNLAD